MATNDQKQQARKKREEAQAAALAQQKRNRNLQVLAGLVFAAVVIVVIVVIVSSGSKKSTTNAKGAVEGISETKSLLAGIPQKGLTMGKPTAKTTVVEFLDVQCPFCKAHQLDEQPKVINQLVKTGRIQLTAQPIALPQMGEDSEAGRTVALRLSDRNVTWNFLNLFYWNQGQEATGYVTDAYLQKLVAAVPKTTDSGITTSAADANREPDAKIKASLAKIDALSSKLGVTGTPSFAIGKTGQPASTYKLITLNSTDPTGDQIIKAVNDFEKQN